MAVGMAIAEKHTEALINDKKNNIIDYKVYCLCGDWRFNGRGKL